MALTKEERDQLKALMDKEKEPEKPAADIRFNLDLGNDAAWERARKLGLVPSDEPEPKEGDEEELDDTPVRRGRGDGYFGKQQ